MEGRQPSQSFRGNRFALHNLSGGARAAASQDRLKKAEAEPGLTFCLAASRSDA
jgi:hypothetical protein